MDRLLPLKNLLLEITLGIVSIAINVFGYPFDASEREKTDIWKVLEATTVLTFSFWYLLFPFLDLSRFSMFLIIVVLPLSTGIGAGFLTEGYGTKGHTIPRFLLGFVLTQCLLSLLWQWQRQWYLIYFASSIIGLLFIPVTLLTIEFILALLYIFFYSYTLRVYLFALSLIILKSRSTAIVIANVISFGSGIIRLCYYYKFGHHLIIGSNTIIERKSPINNNEKLSHMVVNTDEEANIG